MYTRTAGFATEPSAEPEPQLAPAEARLREVLRAVVADGTRFASAFHERLFALAPATRALFPAELAGPREALLRTLLTVLRALETPRLVEPALRQLGSRHLRYGTQPGHYAMFGQALLDTLARHGGADFDAGLRAAWQRVYGWMAACMLEGAASADGGAHGAAEVGSPS